MSGSQIAAEVAQALRDVAGDVGDGSFNVTLLRPFITPQDPFSMGAGANGSGAYPFEEYEIPAMVQSYPRTMIDGTLIQMNDRRVLVAATGEVPTTADRLRIQGKDYRIMSVMELAPSGVPIYFECQARV